MRIGRRHFLTGMMGVGVTAAMPLQAAAGPEVFVLKDANCGCCSAWIDILRDAGFAVRFRDVPGSVLARAKAENGIPPQMASCHTAGVEGYVIEGHVPPRDIRRLLQERPDAVGLAVPGMPYGSPGMGPEEDRDAYDVVLIRRDGAAEVFAHYPAG